MKKAKQLVALLLALAMTMAFAACTNGGEAASSTPPSSAGASQPAAEPSSEPAAEPDTVSMLMPPLSTTYQDQLDAWAAAFKEANPNVTLTFEKASWEDFSQKLDIQINAAAPPDISYADHSNVPKYVDSGLALDLTGLVSADMLADFDSTAVDYFRNGDGLYGLPLYVSIQCLGGNKEFMEAAGIDWKKVQQSGWTYEEFLEAMKKGATDDHYGFIFACAGVTAVDLLSIFSKNAGMPDMFDKDLKYTYTSKNMLELLKCIRQLIDEGAAPKELGSIEAGKRWNMFLTGQTMVFGKGLANFESLAYANNQKLDANDGSAVEGSIKTEYVVLPVPTFFGNPQAPQGAYGGVIAFRGKDEPTEAHLKNVINAAYFMASGDVAAFTCNELYLAPLCKSGEDAVAKITNDVPRSAENAAAVATLSASMPAPRPDIPADLTAKGARMNDEVVIPKFQALLANEITPEQMYDEIVKAATEVFGADGIVAG